MNLLKKACGQAFRTTDFSCSLEQLDIIFFLYFSVSIFKAPFSYFYSIRVNLDSNLLYFDFYFSFSFSIFSLIVFIDRPWSSDSAFFIS